jgi:DNA-binding beta-propeller fold protein YncE
VLCLILGTFLLASPAALAAGQRQHVFSFSFGSLGTGAGQFFHPSGIAVSSSTGDVYVADRENGRLEEFEPVVGPSGEVVGETFVKSVTVPFPEAVAVDNCGEASTSCDETEDPSVGDVYVAGAKKGNKGKLGEEEYLYKFNSNLEAIGNHKFKESIDGLAVDPSGGLFVYEGVDSGEIAALGDAAENVSALAKTVRSAAKGPAMRAFAVESHGNFYVGALADGEEAAEGSGLREVFDELEREGVGVAAKLAGSNGEVLVHALDFEESSAVAVNPSDVAANGVDEEDDVYVTNVDTVAGEQVTTVAAFSPAEGAGSPGEGEGQLLQRFGEPGLKEGDGIAVDPETGSVYVSDGASNQVDVFELEPAGKPAVGSLAAESSESPPTASNATTLTAQVSPAGSPTRYYFEYGSTSCSTSACQTTAPVNLAGEGFGEAQASVELLSLPAGSYRYRVVAENENGKVDSAEQTFSIAASLGLLPDGRAWEMVSPPNKDGAEPEAPTAEGGTIQAAANGDAITYVGDGPMPAESEPEGARGPELTQILSVRTREGGAGEWLTQDINTPNATGAGDNPGEAPEYQFFSSNLALALVDPFPGKTGPLADPPISPPLEVDGKPVEEEGKREQENTPYLRDDSPVQPEPSQAADYEKALANGLKMKNAGFVPLVTKLNEPGPGFGEEATSEDSGFNAGILIDDATSDLSHVVLKSEKAGKGLYEWTGNETEEGTLQPISLLPGNTTLIPAPEAGTGAGRYKSQGFTTNVRHAISDNGTLVFWTRSNSEGERLYVRDTQLQETLELSAEETGGIKPDAVFQSASANGSEVYFTDTQPLTPESGATTGSPDLYAAELKVIDGHLKSELTDLTPERQAGLLGAADSKVIAAGGEEEEGEGGAYVYFVANAALAPGATPGHCTPSLKHPPRPGITCDLYVRHYDSATRIWEPTRLIAALSSEDAPDWNGGGNLELKQLTVRSSPDGRYLAFMSDRSLTGYDNEDASGNGTRDEEVYLYDAQQGSLVCASCNPSGARPTGVLDTPVADGEGLGLVVDRDEVWSTNDSGLQGADHWLAASIPGYEVQGSGRAVYQSRYLSDEGRLFFNSADPLLPVGTVTNEKRAKIEKTREFGELEVGVENVYEYEPGEVGACHSQAGCVGLVSSGKSEHESVFLDASENGNDVFFLTAEELVSQDIDTNFDVYDAHVCESTSPCPSASEPAKNECESEGCQGPAPAPPTLPAPASVPFSGSGNVILPKQAVLPEKVSVPAAKPLTRAQKLAKALKACKKDKKKGKRVACEKQARKKFGPLEKKSTSKAKKS